MPSQAPPSGAEERPSAQQPLISSVDAQGATSELLRASFEDLPTLLGDLGTSDHGLAQAEASLRRAKYGPNELPSPRTPSIAEKVFIQAKNLFNLLLLVAAILSFPTGSPQMGLAILSVVAFNIGFNLVQERRAEKVVEALRRLIPANAKVMRDGALVQLPVSQLVPGDIFAVEEGDRVPADARLLSAFRVSVDQSVLTGEPAAKERTADRPPRGEVPNPSDCPNLILAGTTIATGSGTAVVLAIGASTLFGRIVATTYAIKPQESPLQKKLNAMGRLNVEVAVAVGVLFLVIALVRNLSMTDSLVFMIAVIISLVPEGLQITVTLALAASSLAMAKRKVVVKRLSAVETLGSATVICTDKTGTITTGQMTVRRIWVDGTTFEVTGQGYEPQGRVLVGRQRVVAAERRGLWLAAQIAAFDIKATLTPPLDRRRQRWTAIGDTTDAALLVFALKAGIEQKGALLDAPRIGLIPFDSNRKMMTSVHRLASGQTVAYSKGAAHAILDRSTSYLTEGRDEPMTEVARARILSQVEGFAREAYRVLALAYRTLDGSSAQFSSESVERQLTFVGLAAIYDPPRPDVPDAVITARGGGIRTIMLTGDHELTAEAIARRVGIITSAEARVVSGERLRRMDDTELAGVLDGREVVFARITPDQKFRVVRALRERRETVAVTGDGVNDAPALAEADVGIAMGITGTDVARESSDLVLLDDNFASIVAGVAEGRGVFDNLRGFMTYVFTHNWAELVSFVAFALLSVPLAITGLLVLAIDLVLEIPISLALTVEPPEPAVMRRPPRDPAIPLFDLTSLLTSAYIGLVVGGVGLLVAFGTWAAGGWQFGMTAVPNPTVYAQGATVAFAAIMFGQVGNVLSRRTQRAPAFSLDPRRNRWLLPGILGSLGILAIFVYAPFVNPILGTAPLPVVAWGAILVFTPLVISLEEARKFVARRILPAPAARLPPVPAVTFPEAIVGEAGAGPARRVRPGELGIPVALALFLRPSSWSAIPVAVNLAGYTGSRLVVARMFEEGVDRALLESLEDGIERFAREAEVPYEFVDVRLGYGFGETGGALREVAERATAGTVVIPVERAGVTRGVPRWLSDLRGVRLVLVRPSPTGAVGWPRRVLIPVLEEFDRGPFDVAAALTAASVVPEIDVVATRVIRIPPIVPLYSTYQADGLVDERRELSFLQRVRNLASLRSSILLVRDVGRDVAEFSKDREVDTIIVAGDWNESRHGYLHRDERGIVARSACTVLVTLDPPAGEPPQSPAPRTFTR